MADRQPLSAEAQKLARKAEKLKEIGARMAAVMEESRTAPATSIITGPVIMLPCRPEPTGPKVRYVEPRSRGSQGAASTVPADYPLPPSGGTHLTATRARDVELSDADWRRVLSVNQHSVLREKATEPGHQLRFPLGFDDHFEEGVYLCAGCVAAGEEDAVLYASTMKFECGCGWPGFWTNVEGAVLETPERDGIRFELMCSRCEGHLGHVFRGESWDKKKGFATDERHCVNSLSLIFKPKSGGGSHEPQWTGEVYKPRP